MYRIATVAAVLMAVGIIAGAFGAHALKDYFQANQEDIWKTAVFYQLINSLAVLLLISLANNSAELIHKFKPLCWLLITGVLIFSGSLFLLVLTKIRWLGAITPIGGSCLIIAWLLVARVFLAKS
jgi:uncharacterized membrane protein YgdD (TMEM256/DUF423 family)